MEKIQKPAGSYNLSHQIIAGTTTWKAPYNLLRFNLFVCDLRLRSGNHKPGSPA